MKLHSFPTQPNTDIDCFLNIEPTPITSFTCESSVSSMLTNEGLAALVQLNDNKSIELLKDNSYLQGELQSNWNCGEEYLTDEEMVVASSEIGEESQEPIISFFNTLSTTRLPIIAIRRKKEIARKRISKQELRARKHELNEKAKLLMIVKTRNKLDNPFICSECQERFPSGQSLGGHMSKRHPGKSDRYFSKKQTRERRTKERVKLVIAKKRFYEELDYDYEEMIKTQEGKEEMKRMLNRGKIRALKANVEDDEVEDFMRSRGNIRKYID